MEFKLRYIDNSDTTTILRELDITYYVQEYSIDKLQLVDSETLMFAGRNCSLTIAKIKDDIDNMLMPLDDMIPETDRNYGNSEPEYDLTADGEDVSDRVVRFIEPFINIYTGNPNYLDGRKVFPASYNPGQDLDENPISENISFVPIRDWNEDPYNAYQNEYVRDKPAYYNLVLDIVKNGENIYRGLCTIDSYSFDHKSKTLTLSFTDINGILIDCFDKIGSAQTFYQNVFNSGLMLEDMYNIASKTVYAIYPMLRGIFTVTDDVPISGIIEFTIRYRAGAAINPDGSFTESATLMILDMKDSVESYSFPSIIHWVEPRNHKYITEYCPGTGSYQEYGQAAFAMFLRNQGNGVFEAMFMRFFSFQSSVIMKKTTVTLTIDLETFVRTCTYRDISEYMFDIDIPGNVFPEAANPNNIAQHINLNWWNWGTTYTESNILGMEEITESNETILVEGATESEAYLFNIMNNEGFNANVSTAEAFKAYMFARIRGIYTEGGTMFWKRFAFDNSPMLLVDGYYVESITEKREYYEKPNRDIAEKITDWDRKNLKHKIDQFIGYLDERIYTKYTIKIARIHLASISVGSVIRIHNIGEVSTNEYGYIDILVVSIGYNKDDMEIEGYGL